MIYSEVDEKMIRWVLTVPAIWTDSAKQFMREAAFQVTVQSSLLSSTHTHSIEKYLLLKHSLLTKNDHNKPYDLQ